MLSIIGIAISLLALLGTGYQLYLQRIHNEKSLKPLGQIDLRDKNNQVYIYITNNGVGPMIIDKLTFTKNGKQYTNIEDCLKLEPQSYRHMFINESVKKVLLPSSHLEVFEKNIENLSEDERNSIRAQLSPVTLKVNYLDIYDNKFTFERDFNWFSRHVIENS